MLTFEKTFYDSSNMFQARKKPVIIRAIQVTEDFQVETLEGIMKGKAGDYLVKGTQGELYPVKKNIFETIYEMVSRD